MKTIHQKSLYSVGFLVVVLALAAAGCGPRAYRGGEGTDRPDIDEPAMSLTLDRLDLAYLVDRTFETLEASRFWRDTVVRGPERPLMAVWPIQNLTSQHIDDQMDALLQSIQTRVLATGQARLVARDLQRDLVREIEVRQDVDVFDPATAGQLGRQLGAKYFMTGKLSGVDERIRNQRRMQYILFVQVVDVETGEIVFQNEAARTKSLKG
ncbi:MAG: hypothetical protein GX591_13035 [Planctomycetes bacterium]|nr:hypothetical protein [Planctomycetota bacterium]